MSCRYLELYEYPLLLATQKHIWAGRTSLQWEKPRFIIHIRILNNQEKQYNSEFKLLCSLQISDVKLFLNWQCSPLWKYESWYWYGKNQFFILYKMFINFQAAYCGKELQPLLIKTEFLQYAPLIFIDSSRQNESLKIGPDDIRVEFEEKENFSVQISAICILFTFCTIALLIIIKIL